MATVEAAVKDSNKELKRLQAREDYIAMGLTRSRNALYKDYVRRGRNGEQVPTRNRNEFFTWSEEDNWEPIALERMAAEIEDQAKALADARKRGYITLSLLTDKAIERLSTEIDDLGSKHGVSVAQDVLNRVGVVGPDKRAPVKDADSKPKTEPVSADDPDSKFFEFFQAVAKQA